MFWTKTERSFATTHSRVPPRRYPDSAPRPPSAPAFFFLPARPSPHDEGGPGEKRTLPRFPGRPLPPRAVHLTGRLVTQSLVVLGEVAHQRADRLDAQVKA